jgi:hypothetical protein
MTTPAEQHPQVKMKFTPEEDDLIRRVMETRQNQPWAAIAEAIPNRTARQVRERWMNYLDPSVNTRAWTPEEEVVLQNLVAQHGPKWSKMVQQLENRSDIAIKNHYQLMQRRQSKIWRVVALSTARTKGWKPPRKVRAVVKVERKVGGQIGGEIPLQAFDWDLGFDDGEQNEDWCPLPAAFTLE